MRGLNQEHARQGRPHLSLLPQIQNLQLHGVARPLLLPAFVVSTGPQPHELMRPLSLLWVLALLPKVGPPTRGTGDAQLLTSSWE